MALVNGPLFSLSASGQLGKALVYSRWKGRDYVREYVIPANPRTIAQFIQRGIMAAASRWWAGLGNEAGAQESWAPDAADGSISPFNAEVRYNLDQMGDDLAPVGFVGGGSSYFGGIEDLSVTSPEPGRILAVADTSVDATADTDLILLAVGTDGGVAGTAQHYNRVISGRSNLSGATSVSFDLSDFEPGTYFFAAKIVGSDGSSITWVPTGAAVVIS